MRSSILSRPRPLVIAHRGNMKACPENTMASFRRAIEDGCDLIETDVHVTADGSVVCIHDPTVDRTTDGTGAVQELALKQIRPLRASGGKPEFASEGIPLLEELGSILPEDVALAVELKSDQFLEAGACSLLLDVLDRTGVRGRTIVLSFKLRRIRAFRKVAGDIPTGLVTLSRPWPPLEPMLIAPSLPVLLSNPFYVRYAHNRGQMVCPLDTNPDRRLGRYMRLGCDAVLTNDP
ncbi:MAG: glycerophosphodiester phosphodiesterase family protein, partial [Bacteroidota bacterium]